MNMEQTIEIIENFLNQHAKFNFSLERVEKQKNVYFMIRGHIDLMSQNHSISPFPTSQLEEVILFLNSYCLEKPLNRKITRYIEAYCFLVIQWYQNMVKNSLLEDNKKLNALVLSTLDLSRGFMTMEQMRNSLLKTSEQIKKLQGWNPPSFKLSQHYLRSIDEKDSNCKS